MEFKGLERQIPITDGMMLNTKINNDYAWGVATNGKPGNKIDDAALCQLYV